MVNITDETTTSLTVFHHSATEMQMMALTAVKADNELTQTGANRFDPFITGTNAVIV